MTEPPATGAAERQPATTADPDAESRPSAGEVKRHPAIQKLYERRERHRQRSPLVRWAVVLLGALITIAGLVMTGPLPGPGVLVIPVGLALLALEFVWAERLLEKAVVWADKAKQQAAARSRGEKIVSAVVAVLAIAAFVIAAILWDIPLLPV